MKKRQLLGIIIVALLTLSACTNRAHYQTQAQRNYLKETWMYKVNTNPHRWTQHASPWFLTSEPHRFGKYNLKASSYDVTSSTNVHTSNFTDINIQGNFQIQIVGAEDHNSVCLLGPNKQIRQIIINTHHHTLYLKQNQDPHADTSIDKVIVRIGIRELHNLTVNGFSTIEGRMVASHCLIITSLGNNRILLAGNMNLLRVNQMNSGEITILGANTPVLHLNVHGNGNVNISGNVGIQSINHIGDGTVSVIGANTDCLRINATGCGVTTVAGYANLKQLRATDNSKVYVYWVNGNGASVFATKNAQVGLAGITTHLNVELFNDARFKGSYLYSDNVFVRTHDWSHANVASTKRLFAAAYDNSSIYYLGSPTEVSRYDTRYGAILPIGNVGPVFPQVAFPPPVFAFPCAVMKTALKTEIVSSKTEIISTKAEKTSFKAEAVPSTRVIKKSVPVI